VYLGGIDFNRRIVDHLGQQFVEEFGVDPREDPVGLQQLMAEAEDAKRALSARQQITVHFKHGEHRARFSLTREQFEGLAADLLHRTIFTVKRVMREAGLAAGEVPRILLVGGSTRMPMVREALQRELGVEVDRPLSPDEAVAHGAALYADLLVRQYDGKPAPMSIQNVSSHDLGVLATEPKTKRPRRKVQIPRNTRLPASGTHRFFTRAADQRSVHIPVIEGGDASGRNATPIGKCVVRDLPPGLPAHSPVDVVFQYAENGRLTVTGELPSVGLQATLVVERAAGMSEEQLTAWRERIVEGIQVPDAIEAAEAEPRPDESQADRKTEANVRFEFLCPNGHRLSAPRKKIGLEIDCPSCGEALIIPDPDLPGEAQETEPPEDAFAVDQSAEAEDSEAVGFELEIDEAVAEEALELPEGLPESEQSEAADDPDLNSFLKGLGEE
jgi:molecular chaperone DnaK